MLITAITTNQNSSTTWSSYATLIILEDAIICFHWFGHYYAEVFLEFRS